MSKTKFAEQIAGQIQERAKALILSWEDGDLSYDDICLLADAAPEDSIEQAGCIEALERIQAREDESN